MAVLRAQCSFAADTLLPRDRVVITPHFSASLPSVDHQALANDLLNGLVTFQGGSSRETRVKIYDAQASPPNFPKAEAVANINASAASTLCREVALCLSFKGDLNVKTQRGRLYIPAFMLGGAAGVRPTTTQQTRVSDLATIFKNLGGTDIDWCVYSRVKDQPYSVEDWWVDDEWDIQRRRGMRPTGRLAGVISE